MLISQALQLGDQRPQAGSQDQGEADREGGRWACWGTLTPRNLFSFLCASAFQQFAMLSAADTPRREGSQGSGSFFGGRRN